LNFTRGFGTMPSGVYLGADGFTISFWIKITASFGTQRYQSILNFGNGENNDWLCLQQIAGNNCIFFKINNGTQASREQWYSYSMNPEQWYHMAYTIDSTKYGRNYMNGVVDKQYPSKHFFYSNFTGNWV